MHWKRFAVWILVTACVTGEINAAQELKSSPMFQQWITRQTRFSLVGGRVVSSNVNGAWMFGTSKQTATDGPVHEQISFGGNGATGFLAYAYRRNGVLADTKNDPRVEFALDINSEGRFALRYSDKDDPARFFSLRQVPGQAISLSLPPSDKPRVLHAPTIWHLLIIHAEDCQKQVLPILECIRPSWHVGRTVQAAEDELVKMAAVSRKSDRKQWDAWVDQLSDRVFTRRDRADRNLRDVGPALLGHLNRLDMSRLDAEQRSRLRRIIHDLATRTGEDTPEHVASMLIEEPLVWLALLSRPDESTRQAAVQQLAVLLNVPIAVDPQAEPDSQAKARDTLRKQIEKIVGEGSKPDDAPKPAVR
ncbi:MAG: hypothetical protein ACLP9L_08795 [Thermoguttaceae bacterium]